VTLEAVTTTRQRMGRVGVWLNNAITAAAPARVQRLAVARIEELGYGSVWTGESPGSSDVVAKLAIWLSATRSIVVGSGIANLWARPAITLRAGANTLAEAYPGRLVLGIGVGFARQAEGLGLSYGRPLTRMRQYLDEMDATAGTAMFASPVPEPRPARVLAAVGPKMLALAGERADGAHPFASPVATTAQARQILGPDRLVIPEQFVVFDTDRSRARETVRAYRKQGQALFKAAAGLGAVASPYNRNLLRLGYTEEEITQVSDRVIDATTAYGDLTAVSTRIGEHLDAGADHVLVNPHAADLPAIVDQLEHLAPALLSAAV
jgi:probable F420-dependent oxidoreductase